MNFKFLIPPYKYQRDAFKFCIKRNNAGLLLDLGLGKTMIAINVARYRIQASQVRKVLIVCPISIMLNWQKEISKFSEYRSVLLYPSINRLNSLNQLYSNDKIKFAVINYESLAPLLKDLGILAIKGGKIIISSDHKKRIDDLQFDMIIFDESARYIKTHSTQRTICSILLADRAIYKLLLTGTLIANKPLDVWSQFRVLDGGQSFGNNFYIFRSKFFNKITYGNLFSKFTVKLDKINIIRAKINESCIIKTKKEANLELPDQIFQTIELILDEELGEIYRDVEKKVLSEIETAQGQSEVTINNIMTRLLRLQQITSGFIKDDKGKEVELRHKPKLKALMEQIELVLDNNESAIIWCRFLKTMDLIENSLKRRKIKSVSMCGLDTGKIKYEKWSSFQKSKDINIFIGQIESGGIGIELFKKNSIAKAQHMFFYENTWSLDTRQQAIGRIHRIGQKSTCIYKDLIIKDTIDKRILLALSKNKEVADMIIGHGVREFLKGKIFSE